ncbi:hypothetical protein DYU11_28315 [Fibrisoma montanum]|uniref:NurA domain-containing protein n=1 Tax=Fibrisoma montanum TaxID=2305895 RepID=A0A418LYW7_9BACT|nr:hypothetical protein [Fibrisoma montanum]RIV18480.1 hypothetical protein DYU11_28315 [Fibrisoma montanum]
MIDPESYNQLRSEISERLKEDRNLLDQLRDEIRPLQGSVRRIQPRNTTAISLVGTDGGNNKIQYDPFLIQLVRVVDSSNNEYCLEAITPSTKISQLSAKQFLDDGTPATALGKMMAYLGVDRLDQLSHMISDNEDSNKPISPSWVQVYREIVEWAILFNIVRETKFGTDTLIVFDGLLRSKVFAKDNFKKYLTGIEEGIDKHKKDRRKIFIVGFAKHSKVLTRYRLAMHLEHILTTDYPAFVEIPRDIETKAYIWSEYARGDDADIGTGEINKFVGGKMFFVKFGNRSRDPIWPIDIFLPQIGEAPAIIGYLLADAVSGFPVPFYPLCLQKAHENAALVDFDYDILQDHIFNGLRNVLGNEGSVIDITRMQDADPARLRY